MQWLLSASAQFGADRQWIDALWNLEFDRARLGGLGFWDGGDCTAFLWSGKGWNGGKHVIVSPFIPV